MKTWLFCFLLLSNLAAAENFQSPDIVVLSKLDADWSEALVTKLRNLMRNFSVVDPFKFESKGTITLNDSELGTLLPVKSRDLTGSLGKALGLDFLKTNVFVSLANFSYEVKGFKTDLKASATTPEGFMMKTSLSAEEVHVEASTLELAVFVPGQNGNSLPLIMISIHKPVIRAKGDKLINVLAKLWLLDKKDHLGFRIDDIDLQQMTSKLLTSNDIELTYEKIDIPAISVKIGNRRIDFSPDKIRKYLHDNHEGMKGFMIAQVAKFLQAGTHEAANKLVERYKVQKSYWMPTPFIRTMIAIEKITSFAETNDVLISVNGDFCAQIPYNIHGPECLAKKVTRSAASRLTQDMHQQSLEFLRHEMRANDFDMMASISEDFLNRLIASTIDAGLWNLPLGAAGISFGPQKMLLRLGSVGKSGTMILDGIYKMKTIERIGTGSSVIRFPLMMDVSFRIEKQNCLPVLIVKVESVNTSDKVLLGGVPEFGFESTVNRVDRFKGKVLKTMRKALVAFAGKDLFALPIKELRNMSLQSANFRTDGQGRMVGSLKLEDVDLLEPESVPGQFPRNTDPWAVVPVGTKPPEFEITCKKP